MLLQENVDIAEFLNTKNLCAYLFILFIFADTVVTGIEANLLRQTALETLLCLPHSTLAHGHRCFSPP